MTRNDFIISNCDGTIVDIGSNKGHVFPESMRDRITSVDIDVYDIPNFVRADAHDLPFENDSFNTSVLAEILEHVKDPVKVISEALRVSKRLIITVPNDELWDEGLHPFDTIEKAEERTGMSREDLASLGNPEAKEFFTDDNLAHLWHIRWYTEKTLKDDIKKAGFTKYSFEKLSENGFHWFGVIIDKEKQ